MIHLPNLIRAPGEFDVKVATEELDEGSNPTDDAMQRILEDDADDPTREELRAFLAAQSDDALRELVALTWIGRGDYDASDWEDVLGEVDDPRGKHTIDYLLGTPLLADYLVEALSQFGLSCEDVESDHL